MNAVRIEQEKPVRLFSADEMYRPVGADDAAVFRDYAPYLDVPISDLGFTQQYGWEPMLKNRFAVRGGYLCGTFRGRFGRFAYYPPVGPYDPETYQKILVQLACEAERRGWAPTFGMVPESWLHRFECLEGWDAAKEYNDWFSDYYYDAASFLNLKGNVNEHKRYLVNYFLKHYDSAYLSFDGTNLQQISAAIQVMEHWCGERECTSCFWGCEKKTLKRLLKAWDKLSCRGALVFVDGEPAAFMIGERIAGHTVVSHLQKAERRYKGLYAYLSNEFYRREFPDVQYINLQEDMGISSLRESKEQYRPIKMLRKFTITLKRRGHP